MTLQEIYSKVRKHLLTQNAKSLNYGDCVYRDAGGRACAAGCLITDQAYHPYLEGEAANSNEVIEALIQSRVLPAGAMFDTPEVQLVRRLQMVHDGSEPKDWAARLDALAANLGLEAA